MKICRFFNPICYAFIFILSLSGCNNIDNSNTQPTTIPTETSNLVPSPSIKPTAVPSTPTVSLDPLNNNEDDMTKEVPTSEAVSTDLCSKDEEVLLSFKISDSDKIASICISKQKSEYIIYRYGKSNDIELEYPDKTKSSWDKFTYSYYFRGGGTDNAGIDLNYLNFKNGEINYEIYEEYDSESDEIRVGIKATNLSTGEETDIQGDSSSIKGNLIMLRDNDKINIVMQ